MVTDPSMLAIDAAIALLRDQLDNAFEDDCGEPSCAECRPRRVIANVLAGLCDARGPVQHTEEPDHGD